MANGKLTDAEMYRELIRLAQHQITLTEITEEQGLDAGEISGWLGISVRKVNSSGRADTTLTEPRSKAVDRCGYQLFDEASSRISR
jgi:hypothetical protein